MISPDQPKVDWHQPPFQALTAPQRDRLQAQGVVQTYRLGTVIWPQTSGQYLILSGQVRLVLPAGEPVRLTAGDWFGDLEELRESLPTCTPTVGSPRQVQRFCTSANQVVVIVCTTRTVR